MEMVIIMLAVAVFVAIGLWAWVRSIKGVYKIKVEGENGEFSEDENLLKSKYSTDASLFKIKPAKVYFPKNVKEIQSIIKTVSEKKAEGEEVALTVRSGGTCMSGGSLTNGAIIDMTKHMNRVEVDPEKRTATVEGGVYFREVEDEIKKYGLMFAAYPSSHRICGIGGMIGNNASGEKSLRNGATGDNLLELEVVLANGTVQTLKQKAITAKMSKEDEAIIRLYSDYGQKLSRAVGRVKKAASGYRLDKVISKNGFNAIPLFAGSQGTLGIITKAVLKLTPIPEHTSLVVVSADNLSDLADVIKIAFLHNPESLETFDKNTFAKAREHLKEHAEPFLPYVNEKAELFILAQFSEETKEETEKQANEFLAKMEAGKYFAKKIEKALDVVSAWQLRRNSFTLMRDFNPKGFRALPCIEDVILPIDNMGEFIEELEKILKKYTEHFGYHGHIGDGSFRIIPVFNFNKDKKEVMYNIFNLMQETFELTKRLDGNISADHSDGIIRTPFLRDFYGNELYDLFKEIKNIYDPQNIMNPNKKVNGTKEMISRYLQ